MYIAKVKMVNFKGLSGEQDLFKKTLFFGPNGSGKSRVLEAISIGITGGDRDEHGQPVKRVVDIINNRATM